MPTAPFHTPVLLHEVLSFLISAPDGTYVDATLGGGGHADSLLQQLGPKGRLIGIDADQDALAFASKRLHAFADRCTLVNDNFGNLESILRTTGCRSVEGVLFDLGVSSFQLDEGARGFSFRTDDRLDMRMNRNQQSDAATFLREATVDDLVIIFREYGEERNARRIARTIVERRETNPVQTTGELSQVVKEAAGGRYLTKSLARIFQALRIAVNDELHQLERGLSCAIDVLAPGGRVAVISYHSLEDRIVKTKFRAASATSIRSGTALVPDRPIEAKLRMITKKPVTASQGEQQENPRARSAKLRVAERIS